MKNEPIFSSSISLRYQKKLFNEMKIMVFIISLIDFNFFVVYT